jgi:hypothetical protein
VLKGLLAILTLTFSAIAQDQNSARTSAGCGPASVEYDVKADKGSHSIVAPEAGKAIVYVIQHEKRDDGVLHFGAVTTRIGLDGKWQGANHGQSYFSFSADPGEHHLCVDWQSSLPELSDLGSAATLTSEAGKTYYFRATIDVRDKHPAAVVLDPVDPAEGQFLISTSALSIFRPRH